MGNYLISVIYLIAPAELLKHIHCRLTTNLFNVAANSLLNIGLDTPDQKNRPYDAPI